MPVFWPAAVALLLLGGLWTLFGVARPAAADGPWYVDAAIGDDGNECLSPAAACATVGAAVDKAVSGDTIYVAAGVYSESVTISRAVELIGAGAGQTLLTSGSDTVITLDDGEIATTFNARLEGMTILDLEEGTAGIENYETLTVTGSVIENNRSDAILNRNTGALFVSDSTLRGNEGGFLNYGMATLSRVTISGNTGSTIVFTTGSGETSMTNVTVSDNDTGEGSGSAVFTGSGGTTSLLNSTIADNSGGGLINYGTTTLQNTVLAGNGGDNCWSAVTSLGHNVADDDACSLDGDGDLENADPLLEPLADNGGATLTQALADGSPAIDAGDNAACPAADQRGQSRPVDGDDDGTADCDIGAFEYAEIGVADVTITAPATALIDGSVTFEAVVSPETANRPITYTWTADGQTTVTHSGGVTDSVTFSWDSAGMKSVQVTADNGIGQSSDSVPIDIQAGVQAVTGVTISGPVAGNAGETYTFTAQASPADATLPVTYTWQIDGQTPVTHTGGLNDDLSLSWTDAGAYTLTVTATNAAGSAGNNHTIAITAWYVDAENGDDGNDCQTPTTACATIQSTLDRAPGGAVINVAAGAYSETVTIGQAADLVGAGAGQTVLTAGSGPVVTVDDGEQSAADVLLQGVSVADGPQKGVVNEENLTVVESVIENNGDAGIDNGGSVESRDSTIRGNTASAGAALINTGAANLSGVTIYDNVSENSIVHTQGAGNTTLTNVTVSGNVTGEGTGSAVVAATNATVSILNSTIAGNSGGGVANYGSLMTLQNTVLAGHEGDNCWSVVTSLGHNVEDDDTCALDGDGDVENVDPLLGPLADNGGPTLTHLPASGSPLIDAGDDAACPGTDQRGETRPFDGDGDGAAVCDVGAVEVVDYTVLLPAVMR